MGEKESCIGGPGGISRALPTLQTIYREPAFWTRLWDNHHPINMLTPSEANVELVNGEALRLAGLSAAVDYMHHAALVHYHSFPHGNSHIIAFSNATLEGLPSAQCPVDIERARLGIQMQTSGDETLRKLFFDTSIAYIATTGATTISVTEFKRTFEQIAYVFMPSVTRFCPDVLGPICTCRIFGRQQQCQHTLVAKALGLPFTTTPRTFAQTTSARAKGRPKGKAKPKGKRPAHE